LPAHLSPASEVVVNTAHLLEHARSLTPCSIASGIAGGPQERGRPEQRLSRACQRSKIGHKMAWNVFDNPSESQESTAWELASGEPNGEELGARLRLQSP
jgi:hypothetical protein